MEVCKSTEAAEQKYEWGWGRGGVRCCKTANYLRKARKNFIHMHNSIDRVIVSSTWVQNPRWALLIIVAQAYLQVSGQELGGGGGGLKPPLAPQVSPPSQKYCHSLQRYWMAAMHMLLSFANHILIVCLHSIASYCHRYWIRSPWITEGLATKHYVCLGTGNRRVCTMSSDDGLSFLVVDAEDQITRFVVVTFWVCP